MKKESCVLDRGGKTAGSPPCTSFWGTCGCRILGKDEFRTTKLLRRRRRRTHHVRSHVQKSVPSQLTHHGGLSERGDLTKAHRGPLWAPDKVDARDGAREDVQDRERNELAVENVLAVVRAVLVLLARRELELRLRQPLSSRTRDLSRGGSPRGECRQESDGSLSS